MKGSNLNLGGYPAFMQCTLMHFSQVFVHDDKISLQVINRNKNNPDTIDLAIVNFECGSLKSFNLYKKETFMSSLHSENNIY